MAESTDPIKNQKSKIKNIFLIGYRGTGKTAVAQILANKLGWEWLDADLLLETRLGRSIAQIFAEEGEKGFRDKEESLLEAICLGKERVIATGGGVILRESNRKRLREAGICIWLTADTPTIARRLELDPKTKERRPNLTVGGLAEIEQLLKIREPFYRECAAWTVDTVSRTPEEVVEVILEKVVGAA